MQLIIFTTGRGSTAGWPSIPSVKVASNSPTYHSMRCDMDANAGSIIDDGKTIDQVGEDIFDLSIRVASGDQTCAEINRSSAFSYLKQGPTF